MDISQEMPKYECHKTVHAYKIAAIQYEHDDSGVVHAIITPEDAGYRSFIVDEAYLNKHKPEVGGYYVVYEDGYKSFSPAKAFEAGYTRI